MMRLVNIHMPEGLRRNLPRRRDWLMLAIGGLIVLAVVMIMRVISNARVPVPYQSTGITARWIPPTVKHWSGPIDQMAKKYNLDANLIAILMTMESGGNAKASSSAGAVGLMQITPPTAKDIAAKFLKQPQTKYDLTDPRTNIEFGAAYLAYLRKEFGDAHQGPDWNSTVELIAAGYNGGPGAANSVYKGNGLTDTQTVVYSRDAFNMWRERHVGDSPTFDRWKERGGSILLDAAKQTQ
jgi:soluble lytic murein transglycosylase-like protein